MKLSEAIRLGAMMKPQGFESLLENRHTCAIGAAAEAVGIPLEEGQISIFPDISQQWPIVLSSVVCPLCKPYPNHARLYNVILHLNDHHRWTRERIADWVATVEAVCTWTERACRATSPSRRASRRRWQPVILEMEKR